MQNKLFEEAQIKFKSWYGKPPTTAAYAPGRVEILGNHTDYNEGFVLSAAINYGTFFLACQNENNIESDSCRIVAGDLMEEVGFSLSRPKTATDHHWPNYIIGVASEMALRLSATTPFCGLFFGNVPLGSGLASSAALEMSTALALLDLNGISTDRIELAKIGQKAEHDYVGAKTGLLDQISSLYAIKDRLVLSDFRNLDVQTVPLPEDICFLVCDTGTKHSLGESDYNTRREACERATRFFSGRLDHPVSALRDVSLDEWKHYSTKMGTEEAKRSAHVIEENTRVLKGGALLKSGNTAAFGRLMYQSHNSSRNNFENSCTELDVLVKAASNINEVLGARLSGGGFGGSAVMLVNPADVGGIIQRLNAEYALKVGCEFTPFVIEASDGARVRRPGTAA